MNLTEIMIALLVSLALAGAGYAYGHHNGANAQAVADQHQFDQINRDLADQKAEAADILTRVNADNAKLAEARDRFKTQMEKDHATYQTNISALRTQYSGLKLRFRTTQVAGCGQGSTSPVPTGSDSTLPASSAVVQLPDALATDIRQLTVSADEWVGWYRTCYAYANQGSLKGK